MTKDELQSMVRVLSPEQQREVLTQYIEKGNDEQRWFLEKLLREIRSAGAESGEASERIRMPQELIDKKMEQISEWLEQIEAGELSLEAFGYEDYSSGYWDCDWLWEYSDTEGIGEKITIMIEFAEDCIQYGHYPEAAEILRRLWRLEILADADDECIGLGLKEMVSEGFLHADLQKLALQTLYATYWDAEPEKRAESLFRYFGNSAFEKIRIQDSFQIGREKLPEQDDFWEDWIRLLEEKQGDVATRLLEEAVSYYKGFAGMEEIAARNYDTHPALALSVLAEYGKCLRYEDMECFGVQAMEGMNVKLIIRARIALATAYAASCQKHTEQEYICLLEAFRSDTSVRNLLRLYGNDELAENYGIQARELLEKSRVIKNATYESNQELQENVISSETYDQLCFYTGDFERIKKKVVNPEGSLGWTGNFTRTGLALFLVYLYDGVRPTEAIKYFVGWVGFAKGEEEFTTEFEQELERESREQEVSLFWTYFRRWKNYFPMEKELKEKYYSWASKIIYARADAIVGGQFRNHYAESAALLAALGDIRGAWGDTMEKGRIRAEYKRKFPRHSSFQAEVRRFFG